MYETLTRFLSGFVLEGENRRREQDLSEEITKFLNAHREYQLPKAKIPVPGTDSSLLDGKEVVGMLQSASRGEVPSLLRRLQVLDGQRPVSDDHLTMPVTGFYHEYDEPYGAFSNWYPASFTYAGISYANSEQYMMYQKMAMFGASDYCRQILEKSDPEECKALGRKKIANFNGPLWDRLKGHIMERGLLSKFASNPTLADLLLSTGDDLLCECAPNDGEWGIRIGLNDVRYTDPKNWDGRTLLGRTLMLVREDLRLEKKLFGSIEYTDYKGAAPSGLWNVTAGSLRMHPAYFDAIHTYLDTFGEDTNRKKDFYSHSFAESEDRIRKGQSSLPEAGFFEMKQEIYEIMRRESALKEEQRRETVSLPAR